MIRSRSICLSSLKAADTRWLWARFIPAGCLVAFDGDPECGKSMITVDLAARLSRGDVLPDGAPLTQSRPHRTLLINAEDDFESTVIPRLQAAGADIKHIFTMSSSDGLVGGRAMRLPRDVAAIRRIVRRDKIDLIVIDPLVAFLDKRCPLNSDQAVRRALQPLADLNRTTGSSSLMVRHLNKTSEQKALYRGSGSIGVIGSARAGLLATPHPHRDGDFLLIANKLNLGEKPPSLIYRIQSPHAEREVYDRRPHAPREDLSTAHIEWLGPEQVTADAALHPEGSAAPGLFRAMGWLRAALDDGPRLASELILEASAHGISERTLERAKRQLHICSFFQRVDGIRSWVWASESYKDPATRELEELLGPAPVIEEADSEVQSRLSKAGRAILNREKLQWAEATLKEAAKMREASQHDVD